MTPSERHNALAREFVMKVAAETKTGAEMMVVVESTILATMLILQKLHGMKPSGAAEMVESAINAAVVRFTGGGDGK